MPLTFAKRRLLQVNEAYAAFLASGFPLTDYPGETLQCRNELDRTNWFELRDSCREGLKDEAAFYDAMELPQPEVPGDFPLPEPGIRCTSNNFIRPTVAGTLLILADLKEWVKLGQEHWWALKDQVAAATDDGHLRLIDLTTGWP